MIHILTQTIDRCFGGLIRCGAHMADGQACLLEAAHAAVGDVWSDHPDQWPDLRAINDGPWSSDQARTRHLVPVLLAYWSWAEWPEAQRRAVVSRLVVLTVQRRIAALPGLPAAVRQQCRAAVTPTAAAEAAARAAYTAAEAAARAAFAAYTAARAAEAAARAAYTAARAAEAAARAAFAAYTAARAAKKNATDAADTVLIAACHLWIEAAKDFETDAVHPPRGAGENTCTAGSSTITR